ncbi:MAG TPA: ABC transporter permease [Thermoanaerobaculia bacterium]|nr:ABC transporter permease [Thermoanaerobaculia bacterium]
MALIRPVIRGVRALWRGEAADREVDDEIRQYLDEAAAEHEAAGLSPDDARNVARRELGSAAAVREEVRSSGWENLVGDLVADLRYAARRLAARPGFTAVAVLTLALGIGATTAIFSVVDPILFRPVPYPGSGRVMTVSQPNAYEGPLGRMGYETMLDLADGVPSFESVAASDAATATLTGEGTPEAFVAEHVTWRFFRTLGVAPSLGRDFAPGDDAPAAAPVAILADGIFRRRFASDRGILGRAIRIDGAPVTVVGVMPAGFANVLQPDAKIWLPLRYGPGNPAGCRSCRHLRVVGRLRPGASRSQAQREVDRVLAVLRRSWAHTYFEESFPVVPLRAFAVRDARPVLLAVLGAVGFVLLIACANVTNLLLAQSARRRAELAVRTALGAGRRRLLRQLLTESMLLALVGGALGVAAAFGGVSALVAMRPPGLPALRTISVDPRVLVFALALTTAVAIAFGLLPALLATRENLVREMSGADRRAAGSSRGGRSALVAVEVALALVLLVGSGLLLRSLERLLTVSPGFDPSRLLTMRIQTSGPRYASNEAAWRFYDRVVEAVRAVPGVASAAVTSQLPMSGDADQYGVHTEIVPGSDAEREHPGFRYAVSADFLPTMRIPIVRGRGFTPADRAGAFPVAVIGATMAKRGWGRRGPLGQRVRIGPSDEGPWYTVVGIAGDVRQESLSAVPDNAIYVPESQWRWADDVVSLVVRTRPSPALLASAVRRAVWSVDPDVPIVRVATMDELVAGTAAARRFALMLFAAFGALALILAGAGIYAVLAGSVAERTREIGVRAALGATRQDIVRLVLRQGMTMTAIGAAAGIVAAAGASRVIAGLLFATSRLDPATYLAVTAALAGVGLLACWVPAERAARVDPATTLRAE